MIEWLNDIDRELFLSLNSLNADWLDPVMSLLSDKFPWIPLYVLLIFLLVKVYRKDVWWLLLAVAIGITLSDQITSGFMKPFFERLRPSRDPSLTGMVHLVDGYRGGMYGFASSHASNSFFIATFIYLSLRDKFAWIWLLFPWAILVAYTRIYLGVHYPLDIITGAGIGAVIAIILYRLLIRIKPNLRI